MQPEAPLSRRLGRFVSQHLSSVEDLEVLLFLWRMRARWWRAADTATQLHIAEPIVMRSLERLAGAFLEVRLTDDICFRFSPDNIELQAQTEALEVAYAQQRTALIRLIMAGRSARDFADAFKLRRRE
jgi:hypothetical protein